MDAERSKKIEAGREKLAAYKKKKEMKSKRAAEDVTSSQSSDSSLSLSLSLLGSPRDGDEEAASNKEQVEQEQEQEPLSESSTISEHLPSSIGSIEQDRSYQEIQISNVLSNFSLVFQRNLHPDDEVEHISQENKPPSINSDSTLNISDKLSGATNDVQSILNEILRSERFKSYSEHLLSGASDSLDTNDLSLNIFEGVSLDDSSINNYVSRQRYGSSNKSEGFNNDESLNEIDLQKERSVNESNKISNESATKIKSLEGHLINKENENIIAELKAELDSYRESNHSTLSLNTSTTEYKNYHEDYRVRNVEFQNALAHRDNLIQQLTESLQQSLTNREELQQQSENFAKEISLLQKQLTETSNIIKQHDCLSHSKALKEQSLGEPNVSGSGRSEVVAKEKNMGSISRSTSTDLLVEANADGTSKLGLDLENECADIEGSLNTNQLVLFKDLKVKINMYIQQQISENQNSQQNEIKILKDKFESEKLEYEAELNRLKDLLANVKCSSSEILQLKQELDAKHTQEMEELRTYFEKKCADLEKHYSEEIFSQQSRKMSGSSSCCSEAELPSEPIYPEKQPRPGPGGDSATTHHDFKDLSKKDLLKLKKDLTDVINELGKFDLDNLSKEDFNKLKSQLVKYDLHALTKYDLSLIKHDMQNKYHAELEILREDYENRIDLLNVDYENKLQNVKSAYQEQIDALKYELNEAMRSVQLNVSTAVQEVASSGEYELAEVVQSYERRLQEQVTLAKIDIVSALEHQIQMLANATDDTEWPFELLQIRDRFADKYEVQITELKRQHQEEIAQLKEERIKLLNGTLERARRRSSESSSQCELEIVKDRDNLKKSNSILRHLLSELLKYFTKCEDELNNTLVDEIIKCGFDKNLSQLLDDSVNSNPSLDGASNITKRVHFTPNFADFMNIVDKSLTDCETKDLSIDLKNELGVCLERLRADANAILALSTNIRGEVEPAKANNAETRSLSLEERITSLTRQVISDSQIKNDLTMQLNEARDYVQNLESERVSLENQVEQLVAKQKVLETDLMSATKKISDLVECGHKEIISEGYGQNLVGHSLGGKIASLAELQERARTLVADWKNGADHPLIQLVEELCREGERITDEAKKDQHDLQQQVDLPQGFSRSHGEKIDAADKKLRATCRFLEEQAAEREQERDEAQREINFLREQLKEREKDKATCELVTKEVEQLEQQMRDMTKLIEERQLKQQEVEVERNEAVEKIWVLRDIIRDLESQVEAKSLSEAELKNIIGELEELVSQQNKANVDLNQQLRTYRNLPDAEQLKERVVFLESEVQKLRLNNELIGSEGAAKELQIQLNEFETSIEKRTRDLEGLHSAISTTSCSSPSEDMSIKDQVRSHTPNNTTLDECDVPLQQLARLKEKLVKHSRAEEAAVKRIRDLEMQVGASRHDLEEMQNEKEILQDQVSEQLILISSLQMRLDEQRLRAEHVQKQANTSLEVRIYDLENELQSCKETIHNRDKSIKQLNRVIEQTKQRLEDREKEMNADAQENVIVNLQQEIERFRQENILLKTKIDSDAQSAQILPNLVDNIIADKNADIDKLRQSLCDIQKQLDVFLSFNLDAEQLKQLSQLKSSERAWGDILSLVDFNAATPDAMRKLESRAESMDNSIILSAHKNETHFEPDFSSIERQGPPNYNFTIDAPLVKPNSTEIHNKAEKRVHFEDPPTPQQIEEKDKRIAELEDRLKSLTDLEGNIKKLQDNLERTEDALNKATETFEREQKLSAETEKDLRIELAEKKMLLAEKVKELGYLGEDAARKDQMYMDLAKEKRELELQRNEQLEHHKNIERIIPEKNREIQHLEAQLAKLIEASVQIEELQRELNSKETELSDLQQKCAKLEAELNVKSEELKQADAKHEKEVANVSELKGTIEEKNREIERIGQNLKDEQIKLEAKLSEEIAKLKAMLIDRDCEIEILNEDMARYQTELTKLEEKLKLDKNLEDSDVQLQLMKNRKEIAVKDLEIMKLKMSQDDLNKEILHLQDYLSEKDKIIEQMKADTKSLHVNLETIQNKIQETGNIVDLRKRLSEEQHLNAVLQEEINNLKPHKERSLSIEEIAGQVQKELDYSARLDSSILQALSSGDELNPVETEQADRLRNLQQKLDSERENVHRLEALLEKEKQACNTIQIEDANLIEQMRIQLEHALQNESEFQRVLADEKNLRQELERQITALKQKLNNVSASSNSKTELTEYKSLPNPEPQELVRLRRDVAALAEEAEQLKAELKSLKRVKIEQDASLKYAKDMLQLRNGELVKLEGRMEELQQNEVNIKEKLGQCKVELEQRARELENSRILMNELEQERVEMKGQLAKLDNKLKAVSEEKQLSDTALHEREANLSSTIPEKFLNKMKELSLLVKEHMNENTVMTETLAKLTHERGVLQARIRALEEQNDNKMPFDDPVARANHLFSKYLRSDSYRKALIWQKRYLIALLATYQSLEGVTERFNLRRKTFRSRGKSRFKSVALVVIALVRMRYLVQRWHSGKRLGARMHLSQYKSVVIQPDSSHSAQFQLGQPVSSQNFYSHHHDLRFAAAAPLIRSSSQDIPNTLRVRSEEIAGPSKSKNRGGVVEVTPKKTEKLPPWSGVTPPQKEKLYSTSSVPEMTSLNDNLATLEAPHLLSQCVKRFHEIQQRLGMTIDNLNT